MQRAYYACGFDQSEWGNILNEYMDIYEVTEKN